MYSECGVEDEGVGLLIYHLFFIRNILTSEYTK